MNRALAHMRFTQPSPHLFLHCIERSFVAGPPDVRRWRVRLHAALLNPADPRHQTGNADADAESREAEDKRNNKITNPGYSSDV